MSKKTSVEVYLDFRKHIPDFDLPLSTITDRLEISPTETVKVGEWVTPSRQSDFTQWKYSTGQVETIDFDMVLKNMVHTFIDKASIINTLKKELEVETSICAVVYVYDGQSPGYSIPVDVMEFAVSIGTSISIDEYVYGFIEDDLDDEEE